MLLQGLRCNLGETIGNFIEDSYILAWASCITTLKKWFESYCLTIPLRGEIHIAAFTTFRPYILSHFKIYMMRLPQETISIRNNFQLDRKFVGPFFELQVEECVIKRET